MYFAPVNERPVRSKPVQQFLIIYVLLRDFLFKCYCNEIIYYRYLSPKNCLMLQSDWFLRENLLSMHCFLFYWIAFRSKCRQSNELLKICLILERYFFIKIGNETQNSSLVLPRSFSMFFKLYSFVLHTKTSHHVVHIFFSRNATKLWKHYYMLFLQNILKHEEIITYFYLKKEQYFYLRHSKNDENLKKKKKKRITVVHALKACKTSFVKLQITRL